jgi:hypothetical protein
MVAAYALTTDMPEGKHGKSVCHLTLVITGTPF